MSDSPPYSFALKDVYPVAIVAAIFVLLGLAMSFIPPSGQPKSRESTLLQTSRAINILLFQYAQDNAGNYPDGKSSTEVFQKLLDGKYTNDPTLFYVPLLGKTKPLEGQPLRPENVSWDVTSGVDATSSDDLPVVFLTNFSITYSPGACALPILGPHSMRPSRTWVEWWAGVPDGLPPSVMGIAVAYKNNSVYWKVPKRATSPGSTDDTIYDFIPSTFEAHRKTYRQLTPNGPFPPP